MRRPPRSATARWLYERSLLLVVTVLALAGLAGQIATGWTVHDGERAELGLPPLELAEYLRSGHCLEATFENWESEFLQMAIYVLLTVWLRQKGSAESKHLYDAEEVDREPDPRRPGAPWPVRRGGWLLRIYAHSLSIALALLFVISFALHVVGGAELEAVSVWEFLGTSQLWFESLQNWQSEFVSIMAIVGLSVFLREQGSPESKPVDASHAETEE